MFTGAQAVYSDPDCHALSVTGGSFSTNPGSHVMRGYAAGRRDAESPYLVGEVTAFQTESRAVIQPAGEEDPFNLKLKFDEESAGFAPGSVSLVKLAKEASAEGIIVGETTELTACVDVDGPEQGEWDVSYTVSPFWRGSDNVEHTLVNCFTDKTEITVRLSMSLLSVQEGDIVLARGTIVGEENTIAQVFTVQYDYNYNYPYVDFVCTAYPEWAYDWSFRKVVYDDDSVAAVIDTGGYVEYEDLLSAFNDASYLSGSTVVMLKDWDDECNIPIPSGSNITFDLNGKMVDSSWNEYYTLTVATDASLTVINSNPAKTGEIKGGRAALAVGENTPLTVKGGTLFGDTAGVITTGPLVEVLGGTIEGNMHGILCNSDYNTKVVVDGGTVASSGLTIAEAGSVEVKDGEVFANDDGVIAIAAGDLTVEGGWISALGKEAYAIASDGRITVTGGYIYAWGEGSVAILATGYDPRDTVTVRGGRVEAEGLRSVAVSGQDITIEDGEISVTGEFSTALNCDDIATVNGGSISASGDNSSAVYSLLVVTVNGGEISADGDGNAALNNDGTSQFTVTGGRFIGALRAKKESTDYKYIEISGGVFSEDPTYWLKDGWEARQDPDDQLWYVEEHVEISASWEDDYSAATLTVTHVSGETDTLAAAVTASENEDHSFNITAVGEDAAGRSYSVTLENVASFRVSVGDGYSAWFPVAQGKDYAAFTVTEDMLAGLTPPAGTALEGLEKDGTVYPAGSAVQITGDAVFTARWRSTWARVNEALAAGQQITLLNDIAPEADDLYLYVPADAKPALDLGGHTINRALAGAIADGCVLRVDGGLTLSGGTITGGNNAGNGGGLFVNSSGSVEASSMAFTGNNAANGGGVYVADGGAYSQDGGSITENRADSYGGGLFIGGDGLNSVGIAGLRWPPGGGAGVRNVEIIHNFSGLDGGGVYINKNSLEVDDGSQIINNKVGDSNNNIGVADGLENPLLLPANPSAPIMLGFPALVASTPAWAWATFITISATVIGALIYIFWDGNEGEQGQGCTHPSWESEGAWWEEETYSSVKEVETCTRCGMTREEERVPAISVDEKTNITTYTVKLSDGTEDKREVGPYTVILDTGMDPEAFILPDGFSHTKTITIPHNRHQALIFPLSSELLWLLFDSTGPKFESWLIDGEEVEEAEFKGDDDTQIITVLIDWLYPVLYEHGADGTLDKLDPVTGNPPQEENPSFVPPNTMHTLLPNLPPEKGWQRLIRRFDGWEESIGAQIDLEGGLLSFAYSYAGVAPGVPHKQAGEQILINKPTGIKAQWITPWADLARTLNYTMPETAVLVTDIPALQSDSTISIKQGRTAELQLNGFSLLGLGPAAPLTFNIITVGQDAVLTVTDAGSGSPGALKFGYSFLNAGGVKVASDGQFILQGADICDNVTIQQTYIDPQGHEIKSGDCHGGGVFIDKEGQFRMFSGRIRDNLAFGSGGGVYISEDSLFEMSGGSITCNKAKWTSEEASTQGGGVYVGGTFKVSGKVTIKDNSVDGEASNVYLPESKLIVVKDRLDSEAEIHVRMQSPGVFTSGLNANGGDQARGSGATFFSDDPSYAVVINEAGEAALELKPLSVSVELGNEHGRIGPSRRADTGETIALNVVPNEHYRLKENSLIVSYIEDGQIKTILPTPGTGEYEGKYVFIMPDADVTVTAAFEVAEPFFAGYDLALNGVLSLRYYMLLPADFDPTDCCMTFTIEGQDQTVPYSKSKSMTIDGVTYRVFDCAVYAYQMADNIEAVFRFGEGAAITNGYTVKQYLDTLDMGDCPEVVKGLITATRAYGHFIQPYLYELHHIPHTPLDYEGTVDVDRAKEGAVDYALERFINSEYVSSAQYYLTVSDSTALNVVITLKEDVPGEVSVRLDGAACTPIVSGSTYKIVIPGIAANNLGEYYRFVMTAGNALVFSTDNLSAMAYVNTMLNYSSTQNELNALAALYDYYIAAKNFNENPNA